jgi:chromosome segregation ATPase
MVQADISQLSGECNTWRESLRSYRDELTQLKQQLEAIARRPLTREQLQDVEHYHNQFHIQLINVHDLKQSIKSHDRRVQIETAAHTGQLSENMLAEHESLLEEFQTLNHTLDTLRSEFSRFVEQTV